MDNFLKGILQPIVHQIEAHPTRVAFKIAGQEYDYGRLGERVSAIRSEVSKTKRYDRKVALAVHDDIDTYAAILALWMEGMAYVPLHPNQPLERNLSIIGQVEAKYVVDSSADSRYVEWSKKEGNHLIVSSQLRCSHSLLDELEEMGSDELAYILFTSGSTGVPKGVMISRGNLAAFIESFWKTGVRVDEADRCLQAFDLTFDVSIQSFLAGLIRGACVYTIPYGSVKYVQVASLVQEEHITFAAFAPSMLTYLRPYFDELDASSLKTCILTAEACPLELIEAWQKCAKNAEIYDFYGPTEATIYCTAYKLSREGNNLSVNGIVSIGRPLANAEAIIIDDEGRLVEGSEDGELCVAGLQVTLGYWNNEERNEASFFEKSVQGKKQRYYRTGDLCYWGEDGNIVYLGRKDQQVKVQGFRVELGEIEFHARNYFGNKYRVVAIAFTNKRHLTEIALFVEAGEDDRKNLTAYLEDRMPQYMIPTRVLFEEALPLNNSDKIDRVALRQRLAEGD